MSSIAKIDFKEMCKVGVTPYASKCEEFLLKRTNGFFFAVGDLGVLLFMLRCPFLMLRVPYVVLRVVVAGFTLNVFFYPTTMKKSPPPSTTTAITTTTSQAICHLPNLYIAQAAISSYWSPKPMSTTTKFTETDLSRTHLMSEVYSSNRRNSLASVLRRSSSDNGASLKQLQDL